MLNNINQHFTKENHQSVLQYSIKKHEQHTLGLEVMYDKNLQHQSKRGENGTNLQKENSQTRDPQPPEYFEPEQTKEKPKCGISLQNLW